MALASNVSMQHLGGTWLSKTEIAFPPLDADAIKSYPVAPQGIANFDTATSLYNGMINPVIPYGLAGATWYQGESNAMPSPWAFTTHSDSKWYQGKDADPAPLYRRIFPMLIKDWRAQWKLRGGQSELPFYYCQIANFGKKDEHPRESKWAEVREAQRLTLQAMPDTGMAVLIDIGQAKDIHPTNKQEVGRRLALQALAGTYGRKIEASGPLYQSMTVEGDRIRLKFSHVAGGLVARPLSETYQPVSYDAATVPLVKPRPGSPLQGFEICGADGKPQWADAAIEGDTVLVSSPAIHNPTAVRYAWADNPTCNLYNDAGLPASPFRTDN
jgi:sialate O-acetylesterase